MLEGRTWRTIPVKSMKPEHQTDPEYFTDNDEVRLLNRRDCTVVLENGASLPAVARMEEFEDKVAVLLVAHPILDPSSWSPVEAGTPPTAVKRGTLLRYLTDAGRLKWLTAVETGEPCILRSR